MKKTTYIALLSTLAALFVACIIFAIVPTSEGKTDANVTYIVENGKPNFVIIYEKEGELWAKECAELLSSKIYDITGIQIEVKDDEGDIKENEIRIGATNRTEATYLDLVKSIGADGYSISAQGKNIDVVAFSGAGANNAITTLLNKYLAKDKNNDYLFKNITEYVYSQKSGTEPDASLFTSKQTLRFDENGNFKILMVADICAEEDVSEYTISALDAMIEAEKPNLVLICGNIQSKITDKSTLKKLLEKVSSPMEKRKIPWAHVFGIEDFASGMQLDLQFEVYSEFEYCISKKAPAYTKATSTYFLPILSSQSDAVAFGIWGLDSSKSAISSSNSAEFAEYFNGAVNIEQIDWYKTNSSALYKQLGRSVPSIMFLSTPINEFMNVDSLANLCGNFYENISCPAVNSGLFAAVAQRGDVLGIYCGTDHKNDFTGKYCGIEFGCLASIGYDGYGLGGVFNTNNGMRGGRIIEISESNLKSVNSRMIYAKNYGISRG